MNVFSVFKFTFWVFSGTKWSENLICKRVVERSEEEQDQGYSRDFGFSSMLCLSRGLPEL